MADIESERRFIRGLAGRAQITRARRQMAHEIGTASFIAAYQRHAAHREREMRRKRERAHLLDRPRRKRATAQLLALRGLA